MRIQFAGATDVGRVRDHNEDYFAIVKQSNLAVVCDGMGGHAAGEVASKIAVETICRIYESEDYQMFDREEFTFPSDQLSAPGRLLIGAIAVANQRVFDAGNRSSELSGMGTTVVACAFHNGGVSVCHAGDSRVYLFRQGELRQVTSDHSWVNELMQQYNLTEEESKAHVNSNVITRALGTRQEIKIDIVELNLEVGDLLLLCSDGLSGMVMDAQLAETVAAFQENPGDIVDRLIEQANENGGTDNITALICKVLETEDNQAFSGGETMTAEWGVGTELEAVYEIVENLFSDANPTDPPGRSEVTKVEKKKRRFRWR